MGELEEGLDRADQLLRTARLVLDAGDYESSVSRSYYAMFFAAEVLLMTKGLAYHSHKGVIAGFGENFVKGGPFDAHEGRVLGRALEQRLRADYEHTRTISKSDAEALLEAATAFVAKARRLLGAKG